MQKKTLCVFLFCALFIAFSQGSRYILADVSDFELDRVDEIKLEASKEGSEWWVELGDTLLLLGNEQTLKYFESRAILYSIVDTVPNGQLQFFTKIHFETLTSGPQSHLYDVLAYSSGFAVVQKKLSMTELTPERTFQILPFSPNAVLLRHVKRSSHPKEDQYSVRFDEDGPIPAMIESLDPNEWTADLTHLSQWNRYAFAGEGKEIREWLVSQFKRSGSLSISQQEVTCRGDIHYNILAHLPSSGTQTKWILIGAHYDSISPSPNASAPGAVDNGSGTTSVFQLAKVFTSHPLPPGVSITFLLYACEELGLIGSLKHAQSLVDDGKADKVDLVHVMDMVGYRSSGSPKRVLLETSKEFEWIHSLYSTAAKKYAPDMEVELSLRPFGSDHVPYISRNIPALLVIDGEWGTYPHYHKVTDTVDKSDQVQAEAILRMSVGAIAAFAYDMHKPSVTQEDSRSEERRLEPWLIAGVISGVLIAVGVITIVTIIVVRKKGTADVRQPLI